MCNGDRMRTGFSSLWPATSSRLTSSARRLWTWAMPDTPAASSRCSMWQSNTIHHHPAAPSVTCLPCHTEANWVDFAQYLLPWKTVMTDKTKIHGLNELDGHFRRKAHRLREWYLCVYIKRQEKWWWFIGKCGSWAWCRWYRIRGR